MPSDSGGGGGGNGNDGSCDTVLVMVEGVKSWISLWFFELEVGLGWL